MSTVEDYQRLWDGTEPGWVIVRTTREAIRVWLDFAADGAVVDDLKAIRSAVPEFAALTVREAATRFVGATRIDLGEFESGEARTIMASCRSQGLSVGSSVLDRSTCLPINEISNMALIIEDDVLARRVCEEALRRGLPVRHVEA